MTRDNVLKRLCAAFAKANREVFKFNMASDCICTEALAQKDIGRFQWDEQFLVFIEEAVAEAVEKAKPNARKCNECYTVHILPAPCRCPKEAES